MPKVRLDVLLTERGLAESRSKAQAIIMAGQVRVDDQVTLKPATKVSTASTLKVDPGPRFVSRGGEKLEAALETFQIDLTGLTCADVGASTGGFTDCMLQRGAAKVYAIDVGKGILHWKMRKHPRVVVMEKTNARYVESLPEAVDFVTVDASFISLKILLPVVKNWFKTPLTPSGHSPHLNNKWGETEGGLVALIKPQFEAGRKDVSRGDGVIRDPEIHRQVLDDILAFAQHGGYGVKGVARSPIQGPKGNIEFLAWLGVGIPPASDEQVSAWIDAVAPLEETGQEAR